MGNRIPGHPEPHEGNPSILRELKALITPRPPLTMQTLRTVEHLRYSVPC